MKLIFNADDFGMRKVTTDSIIELHKIGIIKSTTIMSNFPDADFGYAVNMAHQNTELGIGIHLNITEGKPLIGDRFTYCNDGFFFSPQEYYTRLKNGMELNIAMIEEEFTAQIDRAYSSGIDITHIDSHHHFHFKTDCLPIVEKIAERLNLPIRMPAEKQNNNNLYVNDFISMSKIESFDTLIEAIVRCKNDGCRIVEIGCHPTIVNEEMRAKGGWLDVPDRDWKILNDKLLLPFLSDLGVEITNFCEVRRV